MGNSRASPFLKSTLLSGQPPATYKDRLTKSSENRHTKHTKKITAASELSKSSAVCGAMGRVASRHHLGDTLQQSRRAIPGPRQGLAGMAVEVICQAVEQRAMASWMGTYLAAEGQAQCVSRCRRPTSARGARISAVTQSHRRSFIPDRGCDIQ